MLSHASVFSRIWIFIIVRAINILQRQGISRPTGQLVTILKPFVGSCACRIYFCRNRQVFGISDALRCNER